MTPPLTRATIERALRPLAESLPPGTPVPVSRDWLLLLIGQEEGAGEADHTTDSLLTVDEVARRLGISKQEIYRRASAWPFTRRLGRRLLRFSSTGLEQWLRRRGNR